VDTIPRSLSDNVEFMFVSFWDSMDALVEYTGGNPERPKYYPEDRAALLELPEGVEHYQVVDLQARGGEAAVLLKIDEAMAM
jgi:hypothetical protein